MNFINRALGNANASYTSSSLVDLISHEDWNLARMELREKPAEARQWAKRTGFFDGQHQSTVLPIHICVALQPTPEFVDCLINAYPEGLKSVEPSFRRIPLHVACQTGASVEVIQRLLDRYPDGARTRDSLGRLGLHYACSHGAPVEVVVALLNVFSGGAAIVDKNGWLPIHVACRVGESPEVINELLKAYPDGIGEKTNKGSTPLMCARKHEGKAVGKDDKAASECVVKMLEQAMKAKGIEVAYYAEKGEGVP